MTTCRRRGTSPRPTRSGRFCADLCDHHDHDSDTVRQLRTLRWGLVPSWSKDAKGAARLINARRETVVEKPAFRKAAATRRCLLPADGYYEWRKTADGKVPYFLHAPDDGVLAFAGLYELWRDPAQHRRRPRLAGCGPARSSPNRPPTPWGRSTTAAR